MVDAGGVDRHGMPSIGIDRVDLVDGTFKPHLGSFMLEPVQLIARYLGTTVIAGFNSQARNTSGDAAQYPLHHRTKKASKNRELDKSIWATDACARSFHQITVAS